MHKNLKLSLLICLALLVLAIGGAGYAISTINPAQLTQLLSSSVKAATGRDLKIAGPLLALRLKMFLLVMPLGLRAQT